MNLFFLRHAKAFPRSPKWRPDSKRPLTRDGEKKMFDVARGLRRLEPAFGLILTSPYTRALRTAEILAEVYDSEKFLESGNLRVEADPSGVISEINENFTSVENIILVGHEPFMTQLISTLLTGESGVAIELKKAGCCKLTIEKLTLGKCARLAWFLTPRHLARMG
jgi:phosphohistidine phosphatase